MRYFLVLFLIAISGCQDKTDINTDISSKMDLQFNPHLYRDTVIIDSEYSRGEYNSYQDTNPFNSQMPQRVEFFIQNGDIRCSYAETDPCKNIQVYPNSEGNIRLKDGMVGLYDLRVLYPEDCGNYFQGQCSRHSPVTIQTTFSVYSDDTLIIQKRFCLKFEAASLFPKTIYRIVRNERDYLFFNDMKGYETNEISLNERCF